jgi:hypothetical protein
MTCGSFLLLSMAAVERRRRASSLRSEPTMKYIENHDTAPGAERELISSEVDDLAIRNNSELLAFLAGGAFSRERDLQPG